MSLLAHMQPQTVAPIQILVPHMLCFAFQKAANGSDEQKDFEKHQEALNTLERQMENSTKENEQLTEVNKELQDKLYNASQEGREIYDMMRELHTNVTMTKQQLLDKKSQIEQKMNSPRIELLNQVLNLKEYKDHCKSILDDVTKRKKSLLEDINTKESGLKNATKITDELNHKINKKQARIDALNAKIEQLKKDIESKIATAIAAFNKRKVNQANQSPNTSKQPVKTDQEDITKELTGKTNTKREEELSKAAATGNLTVVQTLVGLGTSLSKQDKNGFHPLDWAVLSGNKDIAKALIDAGANVKTQTSEGDSPLHLAARNGQLALAKLLVNSGSNLDAPNNNLNTPLHDAAFYGHFDICRLLLRKRVQMDEPNSDKNTPLHFAARKGHLQIVQLLEEKGADLSAINNAGRTPQQEAIHAGKRDVAEWLASQ